MRSQFRRRNRGIVVVAAVTVLLSVFWLAGSALAAPDEPLCWADWGDLPDGYPTTYAEGGPRHTSPGTPGLGPTVDNEHDTQHDPDALADDDRDSPDDEDGVVRNPAEGWAPSDPVGLDVTIVNADGCLVAWFDWDGDLTLETQYNFGLLPPGAHTLPIPGGGPASYSPGDYPLAARFRLYVYDGQDCAIVNASASPFGEVAGGEIEDYIWGDQTSAVSLAAFSAGSGPDLQILVGLGLALAVLLVAGAAGVLYRRQALRC